MYRAEYDNPNAEFTTNYVPLTSQPADWEDNCTAYYTYDADIEVENSEEVDAGGKYKEVELEGRGLSQWIHQSRHDE